MGSTGTQKILLLQLSFGQKFWTAAAERTFLSSFFSFSDDKDCQTFGP